MCMKTHQLKHASRRTQKLERQAGKNRESWLTGAESGVVRLRKRHRGRKPWLVSDELLEVQWDNCKL